MSGFFNQLAGFIGANYGEKEMVEPESDNDAENDSDWSFGNTSVDEETIKEALIETSGKRASNVEEEENDQSGATVVGSDENKEFKTVDFPKCDQDGSESEESFDDGSDIRDDTLRETDISTEDIEKVVVRILNDKVEHTMITVFEKLKAKAVSLDEEQPDESFSEAFSAAMLNPMEVELKFDEKEKGGDPEIPTDYTVEEVGRMLDAQLEAMDPKTQFLVEKFLEQLFETCSDGDDPNEKTRKICEAINKNMRNYVRDLQEKINKIANRTVFSRRKLKTTLSYYFFE